MTTENKARKGDLVLVERVRHDWINGQGSVVTTSYEFGMVASATRNGLAMTWHSLGYGATLVNAHSENLHSRLVNRYWTMPAKTIDVEAVLRAAKDHHFPGHPDHPRDFDTFAEAKAAAAPYVREGTTSR